MFRAVASVLIVSFACQPVLAQVMAPFGESVGDQEMQHLLITLKDSKMRINGRLVLIEPEKLVFQRDGRIFDLPRRNVSRVEIIERDTPIDGAIMGGAFVAACARWWCGDESTTNRGAIAAAGILGGLLWGWIDSRHPTKKVIFKGGGGPLRSDRASLAVTFRF